MMDSFILKLLPNVAETSKTVQIKYTRLVPPSTTLVYTAINTSLCLVLVSFIIIFIGKFIINFIGKLPAAAIVHLPLFETQTTN